MSSVAQITSSAVVDLSHEEAVNALVEDHLHLVHAIARGWRRGCRTTLDYDDLVQCGAMGLVEAARRFDSSRHVSFGAFAAGRIRGAICDHLRSVDPLTRGRRRAVKALDQASRELGGTLGRRPSDAELGAHLRWSEETLREAIEDRASLANGWGVVQPSLDDGEGPSARIDPAASPLEVVAESERRARLVSEIESLPERERIVLALSYLEPGELTLREIAEVLGVTESRVCQIRSAALDRLRSRLDASDPCFSRA